VSPAFAFRDSLRLFAIFVTAPSPPHTPHPLPHVGDLLGGAPTEHSIAFPQGKADLMLLSGVGMADWDD
jgi:hypothetical protein